MTGNELTWAEPLNPVDDDTISDVQEQLGVEFPTELRAFLLEYQGGVPSQTDFFLNDPRKRTAAVGAFLGVLPQLGSEYMPQAVQLLRDRLPEGVIPIAIGPGGDYVCMDFRGGSSHIIYWHHERSGDTDEFTFIAPSFGEFLALLFEPDVEAESKLD